MVDVPAVVEDVLGNPVVPGDTIAAAFRIGNAARLRIGTVLGFGERANRLTVRVQWQNEGAYGSKDVDITGSIEAELRRFVKIGTAIQAANP